MRFDRIPAERFTEFHNTFVGDTMATFSVCRHCGGACEYNKIGTLMPGEREYMAQVAGLSSESFAENYLDVVVMADGLELDVLRLINGCPFLDRQTYECKCREYKVVLCEIYPVSFQVRDGEVEFEIDDWCPLSDTLPFRYYFREVGVTAVKRLQVPVEWYERVALYDDLYFDYEALQAGRRDPLKLQTFSLEELLRFQRAGHEHDPKERYHPYPTKVVNRVPGENRDRPESIDIARGKDVAAIPDARPGDSLGPARRPILPVIREK